MFRKLTIAAILLAPATAAAQYAMPVSPANPPNRQGLTFEANLGLGFLQASSDTQDSDTETALGGLDLGLGAFINPNLAISARVAGVTYSDDVSTISAVFFGPSAQYWVMPNVWVGGGLGLGVARASIDLGGSTASDSETGFALDLRAGYTFNPNAKHSFNASIELTPAFIEDTTFTGIGLLVGYQFM
jgi:opacity protein-like surface antigen